MMKRLATLLFQPNREATVVECRHCGTSVDPAATVCTTCNSEEIVHYTIQ
ncbi:hypothetical protein OB905_03870 [Halobacteria archaeon AArc-dxtr1]|nr:hypothetical protein [Halobacteria archaeon AArc-dxtr1]